MIFAWRTATSSRGAPNKSAGSPLEIDCASESSANHVALGPARTSGYPYLPTKSEGGLGPIISLKVLVCVFGN